MIEKRKELYIRHTIKKRKDILQRIDFNNVNITIMLYKTFALYILPIKRISFLIRQTRKNGCSRLVPWLQQK